MIAGITHPSRNPANTRSPTAARKASPIARQEKAVMDPRSSTPGAGGPLEYNPGP